MNKFNPWAAGSALAITAAAVYLACATVVALWPGGTLEFFNAWVHGLDLSVLKTTKPITAGVFFYGLSGVVVSAFAVGVVFAVSYNLARLCLDAGNGRTFNDGIDTSR